MIKKAILVFVISLLCVSVSWAVLTQNWRLDAPTGTWLTAAGNGCRGMCYNPVTDHVLVSGTDGATNIQVIDASNGAVLGTMDVTGVAGGTFALTKVRVIDLGSGSYSVFASNLTTNNKTTSLKMYRWTGAGSASETTLAAPSVIYQNRASDGTADPGAIGPTMPAAGASTHRIGDGMDVKNSGTSVQLYLGRSDAAVQNSVYLFDYTDGNAAVSTVTAITLASGAGTAYRGTALDGYSGNIYQFSNSVMAKWTNDGSTRTVFPNIIYSDQLGSSHPRVGTANSRTYIGYVDAIAAGGGGFRRGAVSDMNSGVTSTSLVDVTDQLAVPNANANGTGDFDIDTSRNRFVFLVTNNFVGAYTLPAGSTKKFDNGGGDNKWNTATNWDSDTVPTGADDVILDNTSILVAYDVNISDAGFFSCKTLTLGDASSGNTIKLIITNASTIALNIAGDQTSADDFVIRNGGRFENKSTATAGNVVGTRGGGNTLRVQSGGYFVHDTARSFSTPFAVSGDGAITFDDGALLEFAQNCGTAATFSGRTYANLILSATAAKIYTASGGSPAVIKNDLTIGTNCTFNPSMTGGLTFRGNIDSGGGGGALSNTGGVTFDGSTTIGGVGTPITLPEGFTINGTKSLTLNHTLTIPGTKTGTVNGQLIPVAALTVDGTLNVNGILDCIVTPIGGAGSVNINSGATIGIENVGGLNGQITTSGTNYFDSVVTYVYNGSFLQVTGSNLPLFVAILAINNFAGVSLSGSVNVTNQIVLANGELITGANTLTVPDGGLAIDRTNGFVSGTLTRVIDPTVTGPRDFPIGTPGKYVPVTVDLTSVGSGTGFLSAYSTDGDHPSSPNFADTVNRYWTLTGSGITINTADITFTYLDPDDLGGADENSFIGGRYVNPGWEWFSGSSSQRNTTINTVKVIGATSLSDWTLCEQATPVMDWMLN